MVLALGVLPQFTVKCNDNNFSFTLPRGGYCDDDDCCDDCDGGWGWFWYDGYCYDCGWWW